MVRRDTYNPSPHRRIDGCECNKLVSEISVSASRQAHWVPSKMVPELNKLEWKGTHECSHLCKYMSNRPEFSKSPLCSRNSVQRRSKCTMMVAAVRSIDTSALLIPGGTSCAREVSGEGLRTLRPWPVAISECIEMGERDTHLQQRLHFLP